ncbi:MAG: ABC transporter permease [Acidimicrobiales bacterium]|jgi:ABC-2 type transport system permease protein
MSPLKSPVKDRAETPKVTVNASVDGNGSRSQRRSARSGTTTTTAHTGIKLREYGEYKELFYNLTLRELRSKYKRSVIGWGWSMINPLANMAVYTVVFSLLLQIKPPLGVPSRLDNYALMLLAAMLPWNFFQGSIQESMGALLGNQNLIQKTYFPRELIPGATVASKMVSHLIEMGLLLVVIVGFGNWRALIFIPAVLVMMAIIAAFALGLSLLFSIGNVFYRDIQHFSNIFFFIWMFLTPIAYPYYILAGGVNSPTGSEAAPKLVHIFGHLVNLGSLFKINPMTDAVLIFQSFMYNGALPGSTHIANFANTVPVAAATVNGKFVAAHNALEYTRLVIHSNVSWGDFGYLVVWAVVSLVVGLWVFRKYEARLPEEL